MFRPPSPALVVALALACGCHTFPEPPAGFEGEFSAAAVLDRAAEAAGGAATSDVEGRDFVASFVVTRPDDPGGVSCLLRWTAAGRLALDVGGRRIEDEAQLEALGLRRLLHAVFLIPYFRSGPGHPAEIEETAPKQGGGAWIRVLKTDARGNPLVLSIDAGTMKPAVLREWVPAEGGALAPLDTHLHDFVADDRGFPVPRRLQTYAGRNLVQQIAVQSLRWNQGLGESEFRAP